MGALGVVLLAGCLLTLLASPALAHPGNTASDGCHYCRTRCAYWGEVEGARHCHGSALEQPINEAAEPLQPVLEEPVPVASASQSSGSALSLQPTLDAPLGLSEPQPVAEEPAAPSEDSSAAGALGLAAVAGAGLLGWRAWRRRR